MAAAHDRFRGLRGGRQCPQATEEPVRVVTVARFRLGDRAAHRHNETPRGRQNSLLSACKKVADRTSAVPPSAVLNLNKSLADKLTLSLNCNKVVRLWQNAGALQHDVSSERAMTDPPSMGDPPSSEPTPSREEHLRTVRSADLLQGAREVLIQHDEKVYRLRLTRNGKLILVK